MLTCPSLPPIPPAPNSEPLGANALFPLLRSCRLMSVCVRASHIHAQSRVVPLGALAVWFRRVVRGPGGNGAVSVPRLGPTQLKIFTCEYCNKVFKFKHSLQAHLRIHTNEKPYTCAHCSYASAIKANLNVHLRKHTGEKFSCDCCAFTCLSKGHLKVHVERVHKKVKQHCRFCKKKYSDVKNLIKHVRDAHDPQDPQVREALDGLRLLTREGKRQLLYDCHVCERKFKNELDRDRHMLVHGDQWPFACELCGHGATKYQALELHVRKHPFVYVCALCRRKFVSSIRLRAHIREAHGAAPEAAVFTSSINQSFCLLEPGGDIQPEALGGRLPLAEEGFAPKEDAEPQPGRREPEAPLQVPAPPGPLVPTPQAGSTAPPPCELGVAGIPSGLPSQGAVSDELLKSGTSSAEAHPAPGRTLHPQPGGSAPSPGAEVTPLLPTAGSPAANQDSQGAESPRSHGPDPAEAADRPVVPGEEAEALRPPDLCSPGPERRANMNAFLRILDGLAKRRMDPGLCERIRKVYGDLECEYCGKRGGGALGASRHPPTSSGHLVLAASPRLSRELTLLSGAMVAPW